MLPTWTRLTSPENLQPVVGLYYLLFETGIDTNARRAVTDALSAVGLAPADPTGSFADADSPGAVEGVESGADRPAPAAGKKARQVRRADGDPPRAEGERAESEPMGIEPDTPATPWSLWRAADVATEAESAALLARARALLRGTAGVRHFNPVYSPGGIERQGRLTYGPRVLVVTGGPLDVAAIRREVEPFGVPADDVRSLVGFSPAGLEFPGEEIAAMWVVRVPELAHSSRVSPGVEQAIADGDALSLAVLLDRSTGTVTSRSAVPDWIQLGASVGQGPSSPGDAAGRQAFDWWVDRIGLPDLLEAWDDGGRPAPAAVAVLDGGFDLESGPKLGITFVDDQGYGRLLDALFDRPPYHASGSTTHGTQVASVIAGGDVDRPRLAPDGRVLAMRIGTDVADELGNRTIDTSDLEIALGILGACALGASAITISLTVVELPLTALALVVADLANVPVVAAAGNYFRTSDDEPTYDAFADVGFPARWPTVLSVGGFGVVDDKLAWAQWRYDGKRTQAACWRGRLDLSAPAVAIAVVRRPDGGVESVPGTSFAAPIVAGCIALLRAVHPRASAKRIRDVLRSTAHLPCPPPKPELLGAGGIDVGEAHRVLESLPPEETIGMNGSQRPFDWMTFLLGLVLGMVIAMLVLMPSLVGPGGGDPPTPTEPTATPQGDPHIPVPTIHGKVEINGCNEAALTLSKLNGGSWTVVAGPISVTPLPKHYDFTSLAAGNYRVTAKSTCNTNKTATSADIPITNATGMEVADLSIP